MRIFFVSLLGFVNGFLVIFVIYFVLIVGGFLKILLSVIFCLCGVYGFLRGICCFFIVCLMEEFWGEVWRFRLSWFRWLIWFLICCVVIFFFDIGFLFNVIEDGLVFVDIVGGRISCFMNLLVELVLWFEMKMENNWNGFYI